MAASSPIDVLAEYGFLPGLDEPRRQNFIDACKAGLVDVVRAYLDLGMPHDVTREISHEPALIAAAEGGSIPTVELLLERGAPLEQRDRSGDTAFRTAINWSMLPLAKRLVELGADRDAPNTYDESTLDHVIDEDKQDQVDLLLELGANPNFVAGWRSPMRTSLEPGKTHSLVKLLDRGGNPSLVLQPAHGVTALHEAIRFGNPEAAELLIERGADPAARDAYGLAPIDYALDMGDDSLVEKLGELLDSGPASPSSKPSSQLRARALMWQQIGAGDYEAALATMEREDLPVDVRNRSHETPICAFARGGHLDGVKRLVARGASLAPAGISSVIGFALGEGKTDVVAYLLAQKAPLVGSEGKIDGMSGAVWDGHVDAIRLVLAAATPSERAKVAEHLDGAIMQGHVEIVRAFIEFGVPLDEMASIGDKPIGAAVSSYFNAEIARMLLDAGVPVNTCDKGNDTPLHELLAHYEWDDSREPLVRELLKRGAKLDAVNWQTRTPYDVAGDESKQCLQRIVADEVMAAGTPASEVAKTATWAHLVIFYKAGHHDFVLKLIDAGVPLNSPNTADGVFDEAVSAEDLVMVKALIARGADVDHATTYGGYPLATAVCGNLAMTQLLLEAKARVDRIDHFGWPISHGASSHLPILELLAKHGATFDQKVCNGIFGAVSDGNAACVDFFIAHGAYLASCTPYGHTLLGDAISKGHEQVAKQLLAAGAPPSQRIRENGNTPLTLAIKQGQVEIVKALIAAGASPTESDGDGVTGLQLMTQRKQLREAFSELLLANGVDVSVPKVERLPAELTTVTPEWFAIYSAQRDVVERALDEGRLDPNARDPWGITPLMAAAQLRDEGLVELLLAKGADYKAEDADKHRAWDYGGLFSRNDAIDEALKAAGETLSMDRLNGQAARSMVFDELKERLDRGELSKVAELVRTKKAHPMLSLGGRSLVYEAISRADEDLLQMLIDLGISLDQQDPYGVSPLAHALSSERLDLAEKLVAGGADPDRPGTFSGALASGVSDEGLTWLLERMKDLRGVDRHGRMPIHAAAMANRADLVAALLDREPSLLTALSREPDGGSTPARVAVFHDASAALAVLLDRGVSPDDYTGASAPLVWTAIRLFHQQTAHLLYTRGANLDFVPPVEDGSSARSALEDFGLDEEWLKQSADDVSYDDDDDDIDEDDMN